MKRFGGLYERICSFDNLLEAFHNAKRGKGKRYEVKIFEADLENNLRRLQRELVFHTYRTSNYDKFYLYEPKERLIYRLPFRDRVVHWAIMLVMEPIWVSNFTRDTYACVKKRGTHSLLKKMFCDLQNDAEGTKYCLKIDVRKFYPSIEHDLMKQVVRNKIKDKELLLLLDEIITSTDSGVPIGNYLSQFFANLFLSEFDHIIKEQYTVKYYYRYADDIVILHSNKQYLHSILVAINHYLNENRHLSLKGNFQIFPVDKRGIDFVGYVTYHTHIMARKKNKQALCREVAKFRKKGLSNDDIRLKLASRLGFMQHCNSNNLLKTIGMKKFSEVQQSKGNLVGSKMKLDEILGRNIQIIGFEIGDSKYRDKCLTLQFKIYEQLKDDLGNLLTNEDGSPKMDWVCHICFTGSEALAKQLDGAEIDVNDPPYGRIIKQNLEKGRFFYKIIDPEE